METMKTMKKTINIPFTFTENYKPENTETISAEDIFLAWKDVIKEALSARLNHCKLELFDNRERVSTITDNLILYYTKEGMLHHYSTVAADTMEKCLTHLEKKEYGFIFGDGKMLLQVLKALAFVPNEVKVNVTKRTVGTEGNTSFSDLYSVVLEWYTTYVYESGKEAQ